MTGEKNKSRMYASIALVFASDEQSAHTEAYVFNVSIFHPSYLCKSLRKLSKAWRNDQCTKLQRWHLLSFPLVHPPSFSNANCSQNQMYFRHLPSTNLIYCNVVVAASKVVDYLQLPTTTSIRDCFDGKSFISKTLLDDFVPKSFYFDSLYVQSLKVLWQLFRNTVAFRKW